MNLISAEDQADMFQALDDIWDTLQEDVVIVKEPTQVVNLSGNYMPGWGPSGNPENFTNVPEQRTFKCLMVDKQPDSRINIVTEKVESQQFVFLCVKRDARDYILNGRRNLHVLLSGKTYNVNSTEQVAPFLSKEFFIFKLEEVK